MFEIIVLPVNLGYLQRNTAIIELHKKGFTGKDGFATKTAPKLKFS